MTTRRYSVILGNLGNTCDRFLSSGYKECLDKNVMLKQAAAIEGVTGVELVGTWDIDEQHVQEMKEMLAANRLVCSSVIPDLFAQKRWGKGSFTSADRGIRVAAAEEVRKVVDLAVELNCDLVTLWPGQDGYDYALAADYLEERGWFLEGITDCAKYARAKNVRIGLEYKPKEPRTHSYLARMADTLLMAERTGLDNVGIVIDTGHAFMAYENVGESIAMLKMFGDRLFHLHCNDNYNMWDDDMIVGSVRLVEYFEMLYWLEKTGYAGWYSMDQYPYREDGYGAVRGSVLFLQRLQKILDRVGLSTVETLIQKRDPVATATFIRDHLIAPA